MRRLIVVLVLASVCFSALAANSTLTVLRAKLRVLLYQTDSTNTIYPDALLGDAIYQAQNVLLDTLPHSANWNCLKQGTISVVIGTTNYSLPADFRKVASLRYAGKPAIQIKPDEFFAKKDQATLKKDPMFFIMASKVYVFPTPTNTTQEINLIYQSMATTLATDTTEVCTMTQYDQPLLLAALYQVLMQDNQINRAAAVEKMFMNFVSLIQNGLTNTNVVEKVNAK